MCTSPLSIWVQTFWGAFSGASVPRWKEIFLPRWKEIEIFNFLPSVLHMDSMQSQPAQTSLLVVWVLMTKAQMQTRSYILCWSVGKRHKHTGHSEAVCFFVYFFYSFFFHYYLRLFPFFLAINAFGTTYLGWHVRLFLKQTSIQSLHLVASKVWIKLIKIKVYICPPYFTHKIKTLFWTPSKTGVLKYLTFVSQINVMTQKVKLKNCTKMIKFILKIVLWSNDALCVVLLTISLIKKRCQFTSSVGWNSDSLDAGHEGPVGSWDSDAS